MPFLSRLEPGRRGSYTGLDFGKAENRFLRLRLEEEESPNTEGRDAV